MKRRILFIQNPGSTKVFQTAIPLMIERYKNFFRSPAGGFWNDSEFIDLDRLPPNGVSLQSAFACKMREINSDDIDYSVIIFIGHGASFDHVDHIQLEDGTLVPIDCLIKRTDSKPIKRTVLLDACRVGYVFSPQGWILESKTFSGDNQLNGDFCRKYYNSIIDQIEPHVDIIQSTEYGCKAYGSQSGTDFSVALLDTLSANAKIWNATALGDEYGKCTKNYMDIQKEVANKLHYQTPSFKQDKPADPFPLYAVWRPVGRRINTAAPGISILND